MSILEFDSLLVSNAPYLTPFSLSLTKNMDGAKDLLQETLYRALVNKDKYNSGTNIKAWLYTIMRNIFINDYRRRTKKQIIFDHTSNDFFINYNQVITFNTAESNLFKNDIQAAIHKLPDIFRKPFLLYFEGYKYHEIAELLIEPLGTIKSRIHFARKLLKEQINRN